MSAQDSGPVPDRRQLEQEIARTRAELAATLDELTTRVDPRIHAKNAAHQAKQAATDTGALFTGGGLPAEDPTRSRNVKVLLLSAAAVLALVTAGVLRRRS